MTAMHIYKKRNAAAALFLSFSVLLPTLLTGCSGQSSKTVSQDPVSRTDILFDTVVTITLYGDDQEQHLEDCFSLGKKYENLLSRTIDTSEVSQINQAKGQPVTVSDETLELIEKGLYYSELSGGAFDITIAPVSSLWDFKAENPAVPDSAVLEEAVSHVDYHQVQIDGNQVWLTDPDAGIDLGGIAKGFIADKFKEYLTGQGVTSGIINLGGNVLTIGEKPDGSAYTICIQNPFREERGPITALEVRDCSIVSSGIYERYFRVDDKLYHHILNPATGYPYENNLLGVTIISKASVDGDGLSTTCFALGLDKGLELIRSIDGVEAIFITDDYELHYSNEDALKIVQ